LSSVGRFLNKLSFQYIPAVRGKDIFQHYLNELHDALIDDEKAGVRSASDQLISAINTSTLDMSEKVMTGIGVDSSIQVPKDLRDLFSALDFSTKYSTYDVPLQKRGDGIQARHIPFILDFIARHSKKHHIWAYEEPENSLEMGKAFDLAAQFKQDFSQDNQIYLTTHSPAFYDLAGEHVNKWMIFPQTNEDGILMTDARPLNEHHPVDEAMGIASLISDRAKELYHEISELSQAKIDLDSQVAAATRPQVFVEGPSDKIILDMAYNKLFNGECFCEFHPAGGASKITSYMKSLKDLISYDGVPVIGLYDNDSAGREGFNRFANMHNVSGSGFKIIKKDRVYCGKLPIPSELQQISEAAGIQVPLPIEFMFPASVINDAIAAGVLVVEDRMTCLRDDEFSIPANLSDVLSERLPETHSYLARKVNDGSKMAFAATVETLDIEHWSAFTELFETLLGICDPHD